MKQPLKMYRDFLNNFANSKFIKYLEDPRNQKVRFSIGILQIAICVVGWYSSAHYEDRERKEIAARPHTARILGYQISFPKQLPDGYQAGFVDIDYYNNWSSDGEGRTRIAKWFVYESGHQLDQEDGMQFMVNNLGRPGTVPAEWEKPVYWTKIVRTPAGTKEVSGLKFKVTRWTAEQTDPLPTYKISGIDYVASDNDKLVGLRGYNRLGKDSIILLTDSVLNTFHKVKNITEPKDYSLGKGYKSSDFMGHTGNDDTFKDPYAELIQP